jgi:hypothetical protein
MPWWLWLILLIVPLMTVSLVTWLAFQSHQHTVSTFSKSLETQTDLVKHLTNLLAVKDPLSFQAVSTTAEVPTITYDTSDEAEAQRMRDRGLSDGTIYDEWSDTDLSSVRSELFGQG